ncbi:MAG: galactonate dehydratase [Chloroflexi bacterium]|nr:MAG: galactonate dehydratase [Chloroflexota bacterium]
MRITEITPYPIRDEDGQTYLIVRVDTDAGIHGLGEVGIKVWGESVIAALHHLSELVVGADPWETERLWQLMFRRAFFPADRVYTSAISAIDIALWDIKGKAAGLPVYKLLGGPVRDKVVCYPHLGGATPELLVEQCEAAVDAGWKFLRWHLAAPGESRERPERDEFEPTEAVALAVEMMSRVREAVGPTIEICLDVHTRLGPAHVVDLCRQVTPLRPFFIEDPLRSENPGSYRRLRERVSLPIAAGEQWSSKWGFREAIEEELIDYARVDLGIAGGLTEGRKIGGWAETHFIDLVPHNPLGPVSAAAGVALCMASTNVGVQEMPRAPGSYARELFPEQIGWEDGYAFCPDTPGLGVTMDLDAARAALVEPGGWPPRLQRRDGSFTNW